MSETVLATPDCGWAWPDDVVRTPAGQPAVVLVRTARGWSPLAPGAAAEGLPLVEAMALADLIAEDAGATPEPGRQARLAARNGGAGDPATEGTGCDPRDSELAALRRTVGQLEHALAARVSIERAIGVLAERHGSTPREAFDELRRRARAHAQPAQDLAREVLDGLTARVAVPDPRTASELETARRAPTARRVTRSRPRQPGGPATGAEARS